MKIVGIIPSRYGSVRFPGKPLVMIEGKPMIQHVYEQCLKSDQLQDVLIATDDERIANVVIGFGGKYLLTSPNHPSGTDRCAEAAQHIDTDAIINIQGDEPMIHPEQIAQVAALLQQGAQIATLVHKIDERTAKQEHLVKVVLDRHHRAMYFSRLPIPFHSENGYYQHIGIYGFQRSVLEAVTALPVSSLESSEKLEQLRWLENGFAIQTAETYLKSFSIDTPQDLNQLKIHRI